jgi:hypothetical protein
VYDLWIKDGFLFIGTGGRGVWRGALQNILSVEKISDTHVKTFALEQNYPNPFNPSTIINYKIPMSSDVRLDVFDMLGRKVATLVSERQNAGSYQTTFNAGYFSSGVYFYRLEVRSAGSRAATFNQTKKMLLVK